MKRLEFKKEKIKSKRFLCLAEVEMLVDKVQWK